MYYTLLKVLDPPPQKKNCLNYAIDERDPLKKLLNKLTMQQPCELNFTHKNVLKHLGSVFHIHFVIFAYTL